MYQYEPENEVVERRGRSWMGVFERFNVLKRLLLLKWVGLKPTRWRKSLLTSTPTGRALRPFGLYAEMPFNIVLLFTYPVFLNSKESAQGPAQERILCEIRSQDLGNPPPRCYVSE